MHLAQHVARLRRGSALLGLGALCVAAALSLTQCRMVGEQLTGIDFQKAHPDRCINNCVTTANNLIRDESVLHVQNVQACAGDSVCLALEEIRHEQAVDRIQAGRDACINDCHHQGGGQGGR